MHHCTMPSTLLHLSFEMLFEVGYDSDVNDFQLTGMFFPVVPAVSTQHSF